MTRSDIPAVQQVASTPKRHPWDAGRQPSPGAVGLGGDQDT
jgi:hypothetical protein